MIARCLIVLSMVAGPLALHAQSGTTASRFADAQVGVGFTGAKPDYIQQTFKGFSAYGTFDLTLHLGLEADFHQVNTPNGDQTYERTYEVGGRYFRSYGPLVPYAKVLVGRGVFNYPNGIANLAYNVFSAGAGADIKVANHIRVRADYEYQKWASFPNGGLTPQLFTVGVAYHFAGNPRYGH